MTRILTIPTAAIIALTTSVALAAPQIPTPANPYPAQPVATDGSPLAASLRNARAANAIEKLLTGRSVYVAPRR